MTATWKHGDNMEADVRIADLENPPLDEVILGVQFAPPRGFQSIHTHQVWELYRKEFPEVHEQPRLMPQFETFGGNPQTGMQINFGSDPKGRLWFVAEDGSHLIQFQEDRLLLNWRRRDHGAPYPRHERMALLFKDFLERLSAFYKEEFQIPLAVNQAEVSYINVIPYEAPRNASEWVKLLNLSGIDAELANAVIAETVRTENGSAFARMIYELNTVMTVDQKKHALRLSLTFRGKPFADRIDSALDFLSDGRKRIVNRFCEMTTDQAQSAWGRK